MGIARRTSVAVFSSADFGQPTWIVAPLLAARKQPSPGGDGNSKSPGPPAAFAASRTSAPRVMATTSEFAASPDNFNPATAGDPAAPAPKEMRAGYTSIFSVSPACPRCLAGRMTFCTVSSKVT